MSNPVGAQVVELSDYASAKGRQTSGASTSPQTGYGDFERIKSNFVESVNMNSTPRLEALIDQDYFDSKQLSATELAVLSARKQPDTVFNRIKPAILAMIGVVDKGKSEPRAFPRGPSDDDSADTATDCLRYVADKNRFHKMKQDCFLEFLVPGTMALMVTVNKKLDVIYNQIRWEEFFGDPRSRRRDWKDARYMGMARWMYSEDVARIYPEKRPDVYASMAGGNGVGIGIDITYQDRPLNGIVTWTDQRNQRMLVVEQYYRSPQGWQRCVFHGGGVLDEGPSPYLDEYGEPMNPIEAASCFVDKENYRYGKVRDMRSPQDEINKRRSKLLHILNVSQIQVEDQAAIDVDADEARLEAARPDGVIPFGWKIVPTRDMANGQMELLQEAKSEIDRMSPNPSLTGRGPADASGRALQTRAASGIVEDGWYYGGLEEWEQRIYIQTWARIKQYWKAPQFIRVTDDVDSPRFVGINKARGAPIIDPQTGQQQSDPQTGKPIEGDAPTDDSGQPLMHPVTGKPVFGYKNNVAEMDVDITVETVPDLGNLQNEQFQALTQLIGSNPAWAEQIPFEVILEMSGIPHVRRILDRLKLFNQQNAQAKNAAQAKASAQQDAIVAADVGNKNADTGLKAAKTEATTAKAQMEQVAAAHAAGQAHAQNFMDAMDLGAAQEAVPQQRLPPILPGLAAPSSSPPFGVDNGTIPSV